MNPFSSLAKCSRGPLLLGTTLVFGTASAQNFLHRPDVPDHDQIRQGLPINTESDNPRPGGMYCVPTSSLNILYYLRDSAGMWGIPITGVQTNHGQVTSTILGLGLLMGTDPNDGTSGSAPYELVKSIIANDEHTSALVLHNYYGQGSGWGVNKIKDVMRSGSIARIAYGRYTLVPGTNDFGRNGGHSVTLTGYDYRYAEKKIYVADPASDDGNDTTQGGRTHETKVIENVTVDIFPNFPVSRARYSKWTGNNGLSIALIDSMHQIQPISVGWMNTRVDTASRQASGGKGDSNGKGKYKGQVVRIVQPHHFDLDKEGPREYSFKPREEMVDWTFDLGTSAVYYVTKLGRVFHVDLISGKHKLVHVVKGAKSLLVGGRNGDVFVHVPGLLSDAVVKLSATSNAVTSRMLPGKVTTMQYDPASHGPAFYSVDNKVWSYDDNLSGFTSREIPELPMGTGEVIFRIDHNTGDLLIARKGGNTIDRWMISPVVDRPYKVSVSTGDNPIYQFQPTENELVMVESNRKLVAINKIGRISRQQFEIVEVEGPDWKLNRSHQFDDPADEVSDPNNNWFPEPGLLVNE